MRGKTPVENMDAAITELANNSIQDKDAVLISLPPKLKGYGPQIRAFIEAMVYKLEKNAHKGKWEDMSPRDAAKWVAGEAKELEAAVAGGNSFAIILEAADVANFALMACDAAMRRMSEDV